MLPNFPKELAQHIFLMGRFTQHNAEQYLESLDLQENKEDKERHDIVNLIKKSLTMEDAY